MNIYNTQKNFFNDDVVIYGGLSALSGATFSNTIFTTTSALSVVNTGPGPALYVFQAAGSSDVASFYDGDGVEVLHVGNASGGGNPNGKVGINESNPQAALTVNGAISGNDGITAAGGNSNQWNSNWTTTNTNSANWNAGYDYATTYPLLTTVNYSPFNLIGAVNTNIPVFTVPVGRKFFCTSFGGNIIDVASSTPGGTCTVRLINSSRGDTRTIATNFSPSVGNIANIDNTNVYGNTNSVAVSGGETVSLRIANAPTGFTTLSANMFVVGVLA